MRNDSKGRDIFYGVVAVATLIVAIIGATLAYFSVTASSNEGAINATAAIVSIEYNDGQQVTAQANELIPASPKVVRQVYESKIKDEDAMSEEDLKDELNLCIDSNGKQVCSAYRFTVSSEIERDITAVLNNEHNGFTYLSYAVYDITNDTWVKLNTEDIDEETEMTHETLYSCSNENEDTEDDCFTPDKKIYSTQNKAVNSIFGYKLDEEGKIVNQSYLLTEDIHEFELVLFIKESGGVQNIDQGKNYHGNIVIEVLDGGLSGSGNITGCVGPECSQ